MLAGQTSKMSTEPLRLLTDEGMADCRKFIKTALKINRVSSNSRSDVTQVALLNVFEKRSSFLGSTVRQVKAFIRRIVCRVLINHIRAKSARKRGGGHHYLPIENANLIDTHTPAPADRVEADEMWEQLRAGLPPEEYRVLTLYYRHGVSREDIRDELGRPSVAAVTSLIYRAGQRASSLLDQQATFSSKPGTALDAVVNTTTTNTAARILRNKS